MSEFNKALVLTHIVFRKSPPYDALEGPYSSVCNSLELILRNVDACEIPLNNFSDPVIYGKWKKGRQFKIPSFLGKLALIKYVVDIIVVIFFTTKFNLKNIKNKKLVVGIDPLSCFPLIFLKKIFGFKLVFYSVDFNTTRFGNKISEKIYKKADEICSRFSDQTWVVCESLKEYKKEHFHIEPIYMPNSSLFEKKFYEKGKKLRTGNKMAWTGSCLTERQFYILFEVLKQIQKIVPNIEFYFAPTGNHDNFRKQCQKYGLKKYQVLDLHSRREWQEFAATCDTGIAVYDENCGSTKFIEPLKIWDFMMCGLPFIISFEPSISTPIKKSGVAYFLAPHNKIPKDNSLKEFLAKKNITMLQEKCINLAKEFDIQKQISKALAKN